MDGQSLAADRGRLRVLTLRKASLTRTVVVGSALFDRILQDEVLEPFADKHFNLDVPVFAYGQTLLTSEAIAAYVFGRLAGRLPPDLALERVRIMEDPGLYGDCTGLD